MQYGRVLPYLILFGMKEYFLADFAQRVKCVREGTQVCLGYLTFHPNA